LPVLLNVKPGGI